MNATEHASEHDIEHDTGPAASSDSRPGHPVPPPPPTGAAVPPALGVPGPMPADAQGVSDLERWFDGLAADRTHPLAVSATLRRAGWPDAAASWAEQRYRTRWSAHPAIWWGGFTAIGMAVLSIAGVVHSLIDDHTDTAATWFSVALVSLVFAAVAIGLMSRLLGDWTQAFSASRRAAATTLFWCAIAAAVIRGLVYGEALGQQLLVGDDCTTQYRYDEVTFESTPVTTCEDRTADALAHLLLTSVAATPVALWAWYGHRRPTDPPHDPLGARTVVSGAGG